MDKLRLENIDNIDSLTNMLKLAFSNEDWHNMILIADRLYEESSILYYYQLNQPSSKSSHDRPLIYYLGFSQLCKGEAYQKLKRYSESRDCILKYKDLSWVKGVDEKDKFIIKDFSIFALGNTYTIDLMEGKEYVLKEYVQYLKQYPREIIAGMVTIFECAIKKNLPIEWVLTDLSDELNTIETNPENTTTARYFTEYLCLFSLYKLKQEEYYDAVEKNLEALASSVILCDNTAFKKLVALFESLREFASSEQVIRYQTQLKNILEGVLMDEKDISLISIHSGNND